METVTVFGESSALDIALASELERRGITSHLVSANVGWMRSARWAVLRLETPAGAKAFHELTDHGTAQTSVRVVAMQTGTDPDHRKPHQGGPNLRMLWHPEVKEKGFNGELRVTAPVLAAAVVDCLFDDTAGEEAVVDAGGQLHYA